MLRQLRIREPMTSGGQWTSDDDDDDEGRISGGPYPVIRTIKFIIKGKFKHNSSALYGHHVSTQQQRLRYVDHVTEHLQAFDTSWVVLRSYDGGSGDK